MASEQTFAEKVRALMPFHTDNCPPAVGVALSGGADSVALLVALLRMGCQCVAMHCNFQLRGDESERDERFVRDLCRRLGCELTTVRFDVGARRSQTGESLEMACRNLRYAWFGEVAKARGLKYVAVAHHMEDNVETFFLNLLRGSGLTGLAGMRPERGLYIRPLLNCTRTEIEDYLRSNNMGFVVDSSNMSDSFRRNRLRLHVMPEIERQFSGATADIARSVGYMLDDLRLMESLLDEKRKEYTDSLSRVDLRRIIGHEAEPEQLLFRMLQAEYPAITRTVATNMVQSCRAGSSGKYFIAGERSILLDRGMLIPVPETPAAPVEFDLRRPDTYPDCLTVELLDRSVFRPTGGNDVLWLDADAIGDRTQLIVRAAQTGDRLAPFGMSGTRLLSDIFRDAKLSDIGKQRVPVLAMPLADEGKDLILWVAGLRASRHFPVMPSTRRVYRLTFSKG